MKQLGNNSSGWKPSWNQVFKKKPALLGFDGFHNLTSNLPTCTSYLPDLPNWNTDRAVTPINQYLFRNVYKHVICRISLISIGEHSSLIWSVVMFWWHRPPSSLLLWERIEGDPLLYFWFWFAKWNQHNGVKILHLEYWIDNVVEGERITSPPSRAHLQLWVKTHELFWSRSRSRSWS